MQHSAAQARCISERHYDCLGLTCASALQRRASCLPMQNMGSRCCDMLTMTDTRDRQWPSRHTQAELFDQFLTQLQACGVLLLLTSRCPLDTSSFSRVPQQVHLEPLGAEDAAALLRLESGDAAPADEQAQGLVRACGRNALAMSLLGGLLCCQRTSAGVSLGMPHSAHLP